MEMLESKHPLESSWNARSHRKHDLTVCETKSRLVDKLRILQQRENKKRSNSGQDSVQEELGKIDETLFKVRAIKTAQLLEGWSLYFSLIRCGHLHHIGPLVVGSEVQSHSFPAHQLQARYEDSDFGFGKAEISVFSEVTFEPIPKGVISPGGASIWQPLWDIVTYQASFTDTTSVQVDFSIFHGLVQSFDSYSLNRPIVKDHGRLSRPVFVVWGWQETAVPELDKASGQWASTIVALQVLSGDQ